MLLPPSWRPVNRRISGLLTAPCTCSCSCACAPAAPLWWPSQTHPERHPWSWQSTPSIQKRWSGWTCLSLPPSLPAPVWFKETIIRIFPGSSLFSQHSHHHALQLCKRFKMSWSVNMVLVLYASLMDQYHYIKWTPGFKMCSVVCYIMYIC